MSVYAGPEIANEGLVLSIDVANQKCISPSAARGFNNAPQLVKNLISPSDTITSTDTLRLGNLSYFTAFAIDYPEGSFGGDAANRDGITSGFNVRSGTKIFDFGRALNHAIWDEITQSWVKTQVYDSYVSATAVNSFVSDYYNNIRQYPKATHVVAGSHRDSFHTSAQYEILKDLGAPSNVDSIINFSSPEWILVGKPGLGAGNGAWAFQNYSTNSSQVAHMNFAVPIFGNTQNYLSFNGSTDYISVPSFSLGSTDPTVSINQWIRRTASFTNGGYWGLGGGSNNNGINGYTSVSNKIGWDLWGQTTFHTGQDYPLNQWINVCWVKTAPTFTTSTLKIYINGVEFPLTTTIRNNSSVVNLRTSLTIGRLSDNTNLYYAPGEVGITQVFSRALSATEVQQNFNALRGRYGL